MKNLLTIICLFYFFSISSVISAQDYASSEDMPINYKKRSPIYDYSEKEISNTDTIPDFHTKENKLKITGTIYLADGVTPAKDVIFYICQSDENGEYQLKKDEHRKRYVEHRGWIKTDADGRYTFYTFMPGKFLSSKELKQIQRVIKEPGKSEYQMSSFYFDDDPIIPELSLANRSIIVKSMLRLEKEGDMYVTNKDFKLKSNIQNL
jgi:protocatechuate 3,4-dioxygenase beta subunit